MLLGPLSLHVADPVIFQTKASDMRLGSLHCPKECDGERVGCGKWSDVWRLWKAGVL